MLGCYLHDNRRGYMKAILIGILIIALSGVGTAASPSTSGVDLLSASTVGESKLYQFEAASNTTEQAPDVPPRHQDPDTIEDKSNLNQLERALSRSLNRKLSVSSNRLNNSEYQRARELLGEEYRVDLQRYSAIAEETDSGPKLTQYRTAQSTNQEYVNSTEKYERAKRAYEQARTSGSEQAARSAARELVTAADDINRTSDETIQAYQALDNSTNTNFTDEVQRVETRRAEAQQTREEITDDQLVETTLSVTANQSDVSFTEPLLIRGRLQTVANDSVESQRVELTVNERSYTVALDSTGTFQQQVKPNDIWESGPIEIQYIPDTQSPYLGATATPSVTVTPTPTAVTVENITQSATYDDPLRVRGTLTAAAAGAPVPGAPVTLRIDGQPLETVQTTSGGQFQITGRVPPRVPAGTVPANVGLEPSQLALTPSVSEIPVEIAPTETNLTLSARPAAAGEMIVSGELRSVRGRAVPGMPVSVEIDNTTVGSVNTSQQGQFNDRFVLPETTDSSGAVHISTRFTGSESNLEAATARTSVGVSIFDTSSSDSSEYLTILLLLLGVVSIIAILVALWLWWWSSSEQSNPKRPSVVEDSSGATSDSAKSDRLLTAADEALQEGASESAAKLAYTAVREHFDSDVPVSETATHWEWYQACAATGVDQLSEIQSLIEDFEQVTFAPPTDQTTEISDRMVSTAHQLIETE